MLPGEEDGVRGHQDRSVVKRRRHDDAVGRIPVEAAESRGQKRDFPVDCDLGDARLQDDRSYSGHSEWRLETPAVDKRSDLPEAERRDRDVRTSAVDEAGRARAKAPFVENEPQQRVRVEDDLQRSASHARSMGATMSPTTSICPRSRLGRRSGVGGRAPE